MSKLRWISETAMKGMFGEGKARKPQSSVPFRSWKPFSNIYSFFFRKISKSFYFFSKEVFAFIFHYIQSQQKLAKCDQMKLREKIIESYYLTRSKINKITKINKEAVSFYFLNSNTKEESYCSLHKYFRYNFIFSYSFV